MAAPVINGAGGCNDRNGPGSLTVAYPTSIAAGELLLLCLFDESVTNITAPSVTDFTNVFDHHDANRLNNFVYGKSATGSETGTFTVTMPADSGLCISRMYRISGWLGDTSTWANNFEGTNTGAGTDASIECPSLTTSGADRLGIANVLVADDNALVSFTGGSGGTWTEAAAECATTTGDDGSYQQQGATLASATTLSGASQTMSAADPWFVVVFAIKPAAAAAPVPRYGFVNYQDPGVFFRRRLPWHRRRSGIFVPDLWTPRVA